MCKIDVSRLACVIKFKGFTPFFYTFFKKYWGNAIDICSEFLLAHCLEILFSSYSHTQKKKNLSSFVFASYQKTVKRCQRFHAGKYLLRISFGFLPEDFLLKLYLPKKKKKNLTPLSSFVFASF